MPHHHKKQNLIKATKKDIQIITILSWFLRLPWKRDLQFNKSDFTCT